MDGVQKCFLVQVLVWFATVILIDGQAVCPEPDLSRCSAMGQACTVARNGFGTVEYNCITRAEARLLGIALDDAPAGSGTDLQSGFYPYSGRRFQPGLFRQYPGFRQRYGGTVWDTDVGRAGIGSASHTDSEAVPVVSINGGQLASQPNIIKDGSGRNKFHLSITNNNENTHVKTNSGNVQISQISSNREPAVDAGHHSELYDQVINPGFPLGPTADPGHLGTPGEIVNPGVLLGPGHSGTSGEIVNPGIPLGPNVDPGYSGTPDEIVNPGVRLGPIVNPGVLLGPVDNQDERLGQVGPGVPLGPADPHVL